MSTKDFGKFNRSSLSEEKWNVSMNERHFSKEEKMRNKAKRKFFHLVIKEEEEPTIVKGLLDSLITKSIY